jgi:predicted O-methyltransferase YrrM
MAIDPVLAGRAEAARGFMPPAEGMALAEAAAAACADLPGRPVLEIGSYCGKSALYLAAGAKPAGGIVFTVDHHRGSEEMQAGWEHHDGDLVDPLTGRMDSLPALRRTIAEAGLEDVVVAIVGPSESVGRLWATPLALLFIDGGHGTEPAHADYRTWTPHVAPGGRLAIHDVFPDPRDGGRPPYEIYSLALASGRFEEERACGSLRVLRRT